MIAPPIANAIPARAKTGSGKTAAYALPLLEKILRSKTGRMTFAYRLEESKTIV